MFERQQAPNKIMFDTNIIYKLRSSKKNCIFSSLTRSPTHMDSDAVSSSWEFSSLLLLSFEMLLGLIWIIEKSQTDDSVRYLFASMNQHMAAQWGWLAIRLSTNFTFIGIGFQMRDQMPIIGIPCLESFTAIAA